MPHLFSSEFNIPVDILEEKGVFNCFLDVDTHFFINIKRLQVSKVPEFLGAYDDINAYFADIALLLKNAKDKNDVFYKTAFDKFNFREVNEINLGLSKGKFGSGFGKSLREGVLATAYDIIQAGVVDPRIFHLVGLFQDGIGPDRISDMIAGLVRSNIEKYTIRILSELEITKERYGNILFDGLIPINPYKHCKILLLPTDILQTIPIAVDWDDIDTICEKNRNIRTTVNDIIGENLEKATSSRKKAAMKRCFMDCAQAKEIIEAYGKSKSDKVCIYLEKDYNDNFISSYVGKCNKDFDDSYDTTIYLLEEFKKFVENNGGWRIIQGNNNEKTAQYLLSSFISLYCKEHNWDLSPEPNSGRGPVDFKISRGIDKTVIEIKLTSNEQCVHGLEVQVEEYALAENTDKKNTINF